MAVEIWELWYPRAAATGLPFARCRIDAAARVFVHAAPGALRIEVRDEDGGRIAYGDGLGRDGPYVPMTHIRKTAGGGLEREDRWPHDGDLGTTVLLAGGEAGVLMSWWNADDGSEWRWTVEFYNRR
jgi:hypothetical protein